MKVGASAGHFLAMGCLHNHKLNKERKQNNTKERLNAFVGDRRYFLFAKQ